jgi:hypothetical protein
MTVGLAGAAGARGWWRARDWRPGATFGRRLTRLPPPAVPARLCSLGTRARIERLHSWYRDGMPGQQGQMTDDTLFRLSRR